MEMREPEFYTVEEFEAIADAPENADRLLELINGEIYEKMPSEPHGLFVSNLHGHLWNFVQKYGKGRLVLEVRYRRPTDRKNARIPDISYRITNDKLLPKGSVLKMPDLAIEVKSPDDNLRTLREKMRFYVANGTRLAWLIIPELRIVEVYTPENESILLETGVLDGRDVLPGFLLPVSLIFVDLVEG